jgi:hypothetical protein
VGLLAIGGTLKERETLNLPWEFDYGVRCDGETPPVSGPANGSQVTLAIELPPGSSPADTASIIGETLRNLGYTVTPTGKTWTDSKTGAGEHDPLATAELFAISSTFGRRPPVTRDPAEVKLLRRVTDFMTNGQPDVESAYRTVLTDDASAWCAGAGLAYVPEFAALGKAFNEFLE